MGRKLRRYKIKEIRERIVKSYEEIKKIRAVKIEENEN